VAKERCAIGELLNPIAILLHLPELLLFLE
jgi:hypothetical protein